MIPVIIRESERIIKIWLHDCGTSLPLIIYQYSDIYKWCKENCNAKWVIDTNTDDYMHLDPTTTRKFTYYFQSQQDATLFKLRWS